MRNRPLADVVDKKGIEAFLKRTPINFRLAKVIYPPSKDPLKLNRIRVWFPEWPDGKTSNWVEYFNFGSGYKCGIFTPPRENDWVLISYYENQGKHRQFYISYPNLKQPPPDEHIVGKPEDHWLIRTFIGHLFELTDAADDRKIKLTSSKKAYFVIYDVDGQEHIKIFDHDGNFLHFDPVGDKVEWRDAGNNRIRTRYGSTKDILLQHGKTDAYIWIQDDGSIRIHSPEKIIIDAKQIIRWPTEDFTFRTPLTTHECQVDGIDYKDPASRTDEEFECSGDLDWEEPDEV